MAFIGTLPQVPTLGARLGNALGTGLTGGLQQLSQNKLQEIQQRKAHSALEALMPGAGKIANLPQHLQQNALKELLQGPRNQAFDQRLQELIGAPQNAPQVSPVTALNERQAIDLAKLGLQKQKAEAQKEQFETKLKTQKQRDIDKDTKTGYDEIQRAATVADETAPIIDRMEQLDKSGQIDAPGAVALFQYVSPKYFKAALSPASAEFTKLRSNFVKFWNTETGGNLTNQKLAAFMDSVPDLLTSKEGRERIYKVSRIQNKMAEVREKAMNDIIAANDGERPKNLLSAVNLKTNKVMKNLAKAFAEGADIRPNLPEAKLYKPGTVFEDDYGSKYELENGQWEEK